MALPTDTVANAADAFLARATATTTRRSYGQTMSALTKTYGDRPLEALDGPAVAELAADNWGTLAPATWNRHVATLRSFTRPHTRLRRRLPRHRAGTAVLRTR